MKNQNPKPSRPENPRQDEPTFNIPLKKGYARALGANGGRTGELKNGERGRGDKGGGEREDGTPSVPHGRDAKK